MNSTSHIPHPVNGCQDQMPILQVNGLCKTYGKLVAVQNVSFTVYPQQVFCLVGPNGAGKTSIIDCIVGLKKSDFGDIHLFGENSSNLQRRKHIRSRIGIQFQEDSLYNDIQVKEALHLYSSMYQKPVDLDELIDNFQLQRQERTAYKNLSGGEKRRLLIAIALVGNPELLILDEPSSNLDPHLRRQLWHVLNRYRRQGLTIVMTTHNMQEAQQYSDVVCVINNGQVIASGSVPQLLEKLQLNFKIEVNAEVDPEALADCFGITHVDVNAQSVCIYGQNKEAEEAIKERLKSLGIHQFVVRGADLEDMYLLTTRRRYMRYEQKNKKINQSLESETLFVEGKKFLQNAIDVFDVDQLYEAQERFERACVDGSHEMLGLYYLGLCEYRLATLFAVDPGEKLQCINQAIYYLKKAIDLEDNLADAHALLAGAYGQKIGLKHHLGIVLGPKAKEAREKSKRLEGNNPRVVLIEGLHDYYTPARFGGDKQRAMHNLKLAVELFSKEKISDPFQPSWGYDEACAWLGILRVEQQDIEGAKKAFVKALEVNPNNGWVKSYLLPGLNN